MNAPAGSKAKKIKGVVLDIYLFHSAFTIPETKTVKGGLRAKNAKMESEKPPPLKLKKPVF